MRLRRLVKPSTLLSSAAIVLGIIIGLNGSLTWYRNQLRNPDQVEWERFSGIVLQFVPGIVLPTLGWFYLSVLVAPDDTDRHALKRLAERKLAEPFLSDAEADLWTRVLDSSKRGE